MLYFKSEMLYFKLEIRHTPLEFREMIEIKHGSDECDEREDDHDTSYYLINNKDAIGIKLASDFINQPSKSEPPVLIAVVALISPRESTMPKTELVPPRSKPITYGFNSFSVMSCYLFS